MKLTISLESANVIDNLDCTGISVRTGVLVIETVDIRHEEKHVGVDHGRGNGGKGVIVTELDFRHGEGIVFVDNGNNANVQQLVERILGVDVTGALQDRFAD